MGHKRQARAAGTGSASIRKARLADVPNLMRLRAAVRENKLVDPARLIAEDVVDFLKSGEMWLWEANGRILGFSAGDAQIGWIWALFVDPAHEGRGIGQALLSCACRTLTRAGFDCATLTTDPGTRAARFYTRAGWTDTGRTRQGEIIFRRRLGGR